MASKPYQQFFDNIEQVDIFARGLYWLSAIDGVDDAELDVIKEFLADMGEPELMETLTKVPFDVRMLAKSLATRHEREMFLKTAILLIRADGIITDEERGALAQVCDAFGWESDDLEAIESQLNEGSVF